MTKNNALSRALKLGYSIRYHETENEARFRKPGSAVNAMNQPYEYCIVYKKGKSWFCEERVESSIL